MKSDLQLIGLQQNCFSSRTEQTVSMPSDRLRTKITNDVETFWGKCHVHAENTLHYAEISTVNKINNKAFPMY